MADREDVRDGYDEVAETYAAERSEAGTGQAVLEEFLDSLDASPRVLDAGCGQGTPVLSTLAASTPESTVGLDISRGQLQLARTNAPAAALLQGDLGALPFREGSFDAVVAYHSLIHVPLDDHGAVVEEFARVLDDGGRVLLTEGTNEWVGENPDWLDSGVEMQWEIAGADRTIEQLRAAGFGAVERYDESIEFAEEEEEWAYVTARLDPGRDHKS